MPVTHPEHVPPPCPDPSPTGPGPVLRVEGLRYAYPDGRQALAGVSFEVGRGEKVALVGPNGAGKSTLLLHLNGILRGPGRVEVCGMSVVPENFAAVRARVGLVFQNPDDQLFCPTVFEDVAFGPLHMGHAEDEVRRRVEAALAQVEMSAYHDRLSHHLSAGEKKRIAIATVLAMSPAVLALDEPTAGLDPRARRQLLELLDRLPIAMLVATHDMAMVRARFPRTVVLDDGRIVADGPSGDVFADEALLEAHGLERP